MAHSYNRTLLASLGFADPDKGDSKHDQACQYLAQSDVGAKIAGAILPSYRYGDYYAAGMQEARRDFKVQNFRYEITDAKQEIHINKGLESYKNTVGFGDVLLTCTPKWEEWDHVASEDIPLETDPSKLPDADFSAPIYMDRDWSSQQWSWGYEAPPSPTVRDRDRKPLRWAVPADFVPVTDGRLQWDKNRWKASRSVYGWKARSAGARTILAEVKIARVPVGNLLRQLQLYREYCPSGWHFAAVTAYPMTPEDAKTLKDNGVHWVKLGTAFEHYCIRRASNGKAAETVEV